METCWLQDCEAEAPRRRQRRVHWRRGIQPQKSEEGDQPVHIFYCRAGAAWSVSHHTHQLTLSNHLLIEIIGAPSPPGPLAVVATPPSSQQAFNINHWPENLPWLAFARSLNTTLPSFRQPNKTPRSSQHGLSTTQSRAQPDIILRNDATPTSGNWQKLANITTRRERLNLIQAILPRSLDPEHVPEIQNSMSLLSTTSSHWALKLLIYLASNNLLRSRDLDHIWRLVEETGIKELTNFSRSLQLGETSLEAALEYLFEAGVLTCCTEIVSWLLDIGIDPNRRIRSQDLNGLHLPIVVALLGLDGGRWRRANSMAHLLLSKGALILLPCCEEHNTATHLAVINDEIDAETLELFLQAASDSQSQKLGSQHPKSVSQEVNTNSDDCEAQRDRDPVFVTLESLVDVAENVLDVNSPSSTSMISPETLIKAVEYNNHRLMEIIRSRGLSMNCCNADQESPLVIGLKLLGNGVWFSTIELLLELGASPNYDPYSNRDDLCSRALQTAIHYCIPKTQAELVTTLIRSGATVRGSVSCGNDNHENLMDCALRGVPETKHWINDDVSEVLYEAGLPFPKTCLVDHMKSIHTLVAEGVYDRGLGLGALLLTLISVTTDMSLQSEIGWTALDYAFNLDMKEAEELMLEKGAVHSHKFIHDHCLSGYFDFEELETLFRKVPFPQSDKQRRGLLFYRIIGTLRAPDLRGDALILGVRALIQDYCKLPRSQKHEAYIIQEACVIGNMSLIGLVLELFPSTYSPAAIKKIIEFQTERGIDNWKFIEELLKRRLNISPPSQRLGENRIFLQAVSAAFICKDNSKVLEWFHNNSQESFELANLHPSTFFMNVMQSSAWWSHNLWHLSDELKHLNMNQFHKHGLKTSAYLGLLAVFTGRVDQISDLLHNGMRPNRRFAWSMTILQLAVAREDLPMSRRLLQAGADVNGRPPWRDIPKSIRWRIPEKVCKVLTADYSKGYTKRRSALQLAVEQGDLPMIILLLENGADLNGSPARVGGATALQIACMKGHIDITKLLIERGADVNGAGAEYLGRTALEGAAEHGRLDTIFLLLESGCLVHGSFRKQYIRAVGFARAEAHHTVAKQLRDYGDWTNDDEEVLSSTDLRDIEPESRDLEEELYDDDDVTEVDSEDLELEESDTLSFEMDSESESGDYSSAEDDENATSLGQSTPKEVLDESGSSERGSEPQTVRLDTWDDLLEYYGDDEGV